MSLPSSLRQENSKFRASLGFMARLVRVSIHVYTQTWGTEVDVRCFS